MDMMDTAEKQARVFLWCNPRTVSTAIAKCLSFIDGMEVWSEPFVYCWLARGEAKANLGVDLPMELEGNEEIFEKTTALMRRLTGANVITDRIVFGHLKLRLEGSVSKYVLVKDMCAGVSEDTRQYLPKGFRHTFLIRTPEKIIPSFRQAYLDHYISQGLLDSEVSNVKSFDLLQEGHHVDTGFLIKDLYHFWKYVRDEIDPNPIIIDADDLLNNPTEMLKKYCELVGLPFSEALLEWNSSLDIIKTWKACGDDLVLKMTDFYGRAMNSSCFMPPTKPIPRDQMTSDVIEGIEETMKYYEEMFQHRLLP